MKNFFLTVRHFSDQNALKTSGHDGPLKPGQEKIVALTAEKILQAAGAKKKIRLLYTAKTRRISETANLIAEILRQNGLDVVFQHDARLEVMDQGDLNLPKNYQDGEWFTPLDVAWDAICDEAYSYDNIFYRFGDDLNGKYPDLKKSFSRLGESLGWSLINKYSLIYDLANERIAKNDELLVIVAQSDLPLLIMELETLKKKTSITPANLPYKCWEVYKSGLQDEMYDKKAVGDGNFDIPMGYVGKFDLSDFIKNGFDQVIKNAGWLLAKKSE
jgi:hypothetical protein